MTEWKKYKLCEIGEIVGGATPSTKNPENYDGDIAWLTPKDLSTFTERYISKGERSITETGYSSCSTKMLPANTVLFSSRAPIGYVAIAENEMCTNQGFKSVIPNSKVDYLFLYYLLKFNKGLIEGMGSGTTFKEVSGNVMKNIEVKIPESLDVQKKIAAVLDSIDSKIETNNQINRNLSEQAKTLFKDSFLYIDELPVDWKELTLEDVADLSAGGDKPKNVSNVITEECSVPIYSNGISDEGLYGYTDKAKITEESVTVSARGTIGYTCLRQEPYVPIVRLITVTPKLDCMTAKYLYLWLESLHIMGTGTTQQQLTVPDFKKTRIVVPPLKVINEFTEMVNPVYTTILKNKSENRKLSKLRDSLLPKLMSGELDVSDLDI